MGEMSRKGRLITQNNDILQDKYKRIKVCFQTEQVRNCKKE